MNFTSGMKTSIHSEAETPLEALESDADIQRKAALLQMYVAIFGGIPNDYKERIINALYRSRGVNNDTD